MEAAIVVIVLGSMLIPILMLLAALGFDIAVLVYAAWRWWHDDLSGAVRRFAVELTAPLHLPTRLAQRHR